MSNREARKQRRIEQRKEARRQEEIAKAKEKRNHMINKKKDS